MIQRIQSLYLLVTAVLMCLMLVFPIGRFLIGDDEFLLTAFKFGADQSDVIYYASTVYMGILIVMSMAISFFNVFCYRHRLLQIRLCFMNIVLMFGVQVFVAYYLYHATVSVDSVSGGVTKYSLVGIFPLVGIILTWLASRGIMKDEALVRSLDRIR